MPAFQRLIRHPWSLGLLGVLTVLLLWWITTASGSVNKLFLPSPQAVWLAGQQQWTSGLLLKDALASIQRVFIGFAMSAGLALPVGIAMGTSPVICRLLEPLMGLIRYMPAPAFIPLLIIYFGLDELPKVLLIFIGTFFFNTLMIMDSVKFVPRELMETARTLGGRTLPILVKVVAPFIAPQVLDTYRINMASAWNLVIVAELVAATEGLGKRISLAQRFLRTDEIFMGLIVIGLIGLLIDLGFRAVMRRACAWAN
jgi:NitT/TauT family transport system permease protein